jgi:hypothetical protein
LEIAAFERIFFASVGEQGQIPITMVARISALPPMRRTLVLLSLAISAVALSGCATITRGTHEALVIESEPSGAQVRLSTGFTGTTPTSFKIPRKGDVFVTIFKEGFETVNVNVTTQIAGAGAAGMAGNVLVGGIIGAGVDAFSGGMLEHKPNPVRVTLVPLKPLPMAVTSSPSSTIIAPPPQQLAPSPTPVEAPAQPAAAAAPNATVDSETPAQSPAGTTVSNEAKPNT